MTPWHVREAGIYALENGYTTYTSNAGLPRLRELIFADMGYQIDNMEGLSVHRTTAGDTILTLVSDDNFSALQRTILLQFKLVED